MEQLRRYDVVVEGSTVAVMEAGPSRCPETVVIIGASSDVAASALTVLGRIARTVALDHISSAVLDELDLVNPHLVLLSGGADMNEIVDLLQRTITID